MPLTLVTGPANSGKARHVLDEVRARLAEGPVLVVPNPGDVARYRRELAGGGAVFGAQVVAFDRLASEIGERAGYPARVVDGVQRRRLVEVAVQRARPRALAQAAATPGFPLAAEGLIAELERSLVTPPRFTAALRAWGEAEPARAAYAADIAGLYATYRRLLDELGLVDRELYAWGALDALRAAPASWGRSPVFFYGFDDLTPLQRDAVETLLRVPGLAVTLALTYEPGRAAFATRAATVNELAPVAQRHVALPARPDHYAPGSRAALHRLERGLFEDAPAGTPVDPAGALALLEGGSERAELELVAAEALALLRAGTAPAEIVVVHRSPAAQAELIEDVFGAYGVPLHLAIARPLARTALGRGLLGVLRAALLDGDTDDVLAWLRAPGVAEPRLADAVERDLRRRGCGRAQDALQTLRERGFGVEEVERLSAAMQDGPAGPLRALARLAGRLLAAPRRREAAVLAPAERLEAAAAVAVRGALDGLERLAAQDPALSPSPAELERTLASLEVHPPAPATGRAVEVRHPLAIRARRVRALLVCGLQEGTFPRAPLPDPFLGEEDRAAIARASGLRLLRHDDAFERERFLFYACVSRPEQRLVLSWRTGDDDGGPAIPSLFLEDVGDLFEPAALEAATRRRGLGQLTWAPEEAPTERERALAEVARGPRAPQPTIAPLRAHEVLEALRARPTISAGQLESYAGCPVKWLVEQLLRPDELEPDAEPLLRGGVAHRALEDVLAGVRERTGSARITQATLAQARELVREALERRERGAPLSTRPARRRVLRRRLEADLLAYLADLAQGKAPHEPRDFELAFGAGEDAQAAPLELEPGLAVAGRIDRIDVRPGSQEAVVVDYKGSSAPARARWAPDRRLQVGLYLLAVREALGLRPVAGLYQPLGGSRKPRGLVLSGAGVEGTTSTDVVDPETFERVLDEVRELAVQAAGALRAGRLEPRPEGCHWKGGGCAYPSVCRCEGR